MSPRSLRTVVCVLAVIALAAPATGLPLAKPRPDTVVGGSSLLTTAPAPLDFAPGIADGARFSAADSASDVLAASSSDALGWEPWMAEQQARLAAFPGFLGLVPALPGVKAVAAMWSGTAGAEVAAPAGWKVQVTEHAQPQPLGLQKVKKLITVYNSGMVPNPDLWNHKIGPGTQLLMDEDGDGWGEWLCTANFVWKDQSGNLYLGAAGHCFMPQGQVATTSAGGSYTPTWKVYACLDDCLLGGQSGTAMQDLIIEQFVQLGTIAYARQSQGGVDIGNDFGLVRIPSNMRQLASPEVPAWGGPAGVDNSFGLGKTALIHGNGAYDGEVFATKSRVGVSLGASTTSFSTLMKSSGGDSGSAIGSLGIGQAPGVTVPKAAGILTHGLQVPYAGYGLGLMMGTTVPQAKAMATQAGLCIVPVNGDQNPLTSPNGTC